MKSNKKYLIAAATLLWAVMGASQAETVDASPELALSEEIMEEIRLDCTEIAQSEGIPADDQPAYIESCITLSVEVELNAMNEPVDSTYTEENAENVEMMSEGDMQDNVEVLDLSSENNDGNVVVVTE